MQLTVCVVGNLCFSQDRQTDKQKTDDRQTDRTTVFQLEVEEAHHGAITRALLNWSYLYHFLLALSESMKASAEAAS